MFERYDFSANGLGACSSSTIIDPIYLNWPESVKREEESGVSTAYSFHLCSNDLRSPDTMDSELWNLEGHRSIISVAGTTVRGLFGMRAGSVNFGTTRTLLLFWRRRRDRKWGRRIDFKTASAAGYQRRNETCEAGFDQTAAKAYPPQQHARRTEGWVRVPPVR